MNTEEHAGFDPWTAPLDELAAMAREIGAHGDPKARDLSTVDARRLFADHILRVLQARAAVEAAELQRQAIEDQTEKTRKLVIGTWVLAGATIILAAAAMAALFLGA